MSYPRQIPLDRNRTPMQEYPPPYPAVAVWNETNASASSVVSFNDNTSTIEVAAINGAAALRWLPVGAANTSVIAAGATANFDHVVSKDTVRKFVVPKETATVSSIVGVLKKEGLYQRLAVISVGVASVLTTEY